MREKRAIVEHWAEDTGGEAGDESQTAEMRGEPVSGQFPRCNRCFDALAQIRIRALKELST